MSDQDIVNCQLKQCKREKVKYRYTSDRNGNVDDTDHNLDVDDSDDIFNTTGALVVITVYGVSPTPLQSWNLSVPSVLAAV